MMIKTREIQVYIPGFHPFLMFRVWRAARNIKASGVTADQIVEWAKRMGFTSIKVERRS